MYKFILCDDFTKMWIDQIVLYSWGPFVQRFNVSKEGVSRHLAFRFRQKRMRSAGVDHFKGRL